MKDFTRTAVWILAILGAIALLLHLLVFDTWVVPGNDPAFAASVVPTLLPQDRILTRRGSSPVVGELARCASPTTTGEYVVGRVFGMAGDTVQVDENGPTTNGKPHPARHGCPQVTVVHPVTGSLVPMNCGVVETGAWSYQFVSHPEMRVGTHSARVEAGKLYLLSDNRLMHQDSRDFGQVEAATCEHIVFRLWGERYTDGSRRFDILW